MNGAEIFSYNDSLDGGTNLSYIGNVATNVTQLFDFKSGSYSNLTAMWNSGVLDRAYHLLIMARWSLSRTPGLLPHQLINFYLRATALIQLETPMACSMFILLPMSL